MNETNDGALSMPQVIDEPTGADTPLGDADRIHTTPTDEGGDDSPSADAEFEALIGKGGKFKEAYDKRVRRAITGRYRHYKEMERLTGTIQPILDELAARHGVDPADTDALLALLQTPQIPARPIENGNAGRSASLHTTRVDTMTGEDIRRIVSLVERGERITF